MRVPSPPRVIEEIFKWATIITQYLKSQKVDALTQSISGTYQQSEIETIQDKLNELIGKIDT